MLCFTHISNKAAYVHHSARQNAATWAGAPGLPQLLEQPSQLLASLGVSQAVVFERKAGHETKQSFLWGKLGMMAHSMVHTKKHGCRPSFLLPVFPHVGDITTFFTLSFFVTKDYKLESFTLESFLRGDALCIHETDRPLTDQPCCSSKGWFMLNINQKYHRLRHEDHLQDTTMLSPAPALRLPLTDRAAYSNRHSKEGLGSWNWTLSGYHGWKACILKEHSFLCNDMSWILHEA